MSEQEFVEVKLRIPKRVDAWFRSHYENVEEQYQGELLDSLRASLDVLGEDYLDEEGKEVWQFLEEMWKGTRIINNVVCPKCGNHWFTKSVAKYVSCSKCHTKFRRLGREV